MKKSNKNLYETLGVTPNATPDEIKRARRKKASEAHPDKGGDHDKMTVINHAFDVLRDPERRAKYDATGDDLKDNPIDDRATDLIVQAFHKAVIDDSPHILKTARKLIQSDKEKMIRHCSTLTSRRKSIEEKREFISVKTGDNLFHGIIDQQIQAIDSEINSINQMLEVVKAALAMLDNYTSNQPEAQTLTIEMLNKLYSEHYRSTDFPFEHAPFGGKSPFQP